MKINHSFRGEGWGVNQLVPPPPIQLSELQKHGDELVTKSSGCTGIPNLQKWRLYKTALTKTVAKVKDLMGDFDDAAKELYASRVKCQVDACKLVTDFVVTELRRRAGVAADRLPDCSSRELGIVETLPSVESLGLVAAFDPSQEAVAAFTEAMAKFSSELVHIHILVENLHKGRCSNTDTKFPPKEMSWLASQAQGQWFDSFRKLCFELSKRPFQNRVEEWSRTPDYKIAQSLSGRWTFEALKASLSAQVDEDDAELDDSKADLANDICDYGAALFPEFEHETGFGNSIDVVVDFAAAAAASESEGDGRSPPLLSTALLSLGMKTLRMVAIGNPKFQPGAAASHWASLNDARKHVQALKTKAAGVAGQRRWGDGTKLPIAALLDGAETCIKEMKQSWFSAGCTVWKEYLDAAEAVTYKEDFKEIDDLLQKPITKDHARRLFKLSGGPSGQAFGECSPIAIELYQPLVAMQEELGIGEDDRVTDAIKRRVAIKRVSNNMVMMVTLWRSLAGEESRAGVCKTVLEGVEGPGEPANENLIALLRQAAAGRGNLPR